MKADELSLLEDALEALPEVVIVFTPEGNILRWNRRVREETGYDDEEIAQMHPVQFVSPEEADLVRDQINKVLTKGRTRAEVRLQTKEGDLIPYEFTGTLIKTEDRNLICGLGRDVTDRKRTEKALEESEEKFRKVAEGAPVGIALLHDGTHEYVNPALVEMTGYSQEELLQNSPKLFVHPEDWPRVKNQIEKRVEGDVERSHYETRFRTKSGSTRFVEVSGRRVNYSGRVVTIAVVQDVTEEKRLQREMLKVQEIERKHLGQELHDGLASELAGASMMLARAREVAEKHCPEVAQQVEGAWDIVKDTSKDVRRLSRGLNPAGLGEGELVSALEHLVETGEETCLEIDVAMNDGGNSLLEREDITHLYRIAQEAVNNARRYAEADDIVVRVSHDGRALVLEIEDNGTGFDITALEKAKSMGLRSMRHRAEVLGGSLTIESDPGAGTLVTCRLPLEVAP